MPTRGKSVPIAAGLPVIGSMLQLRNDFMGSFLRAHEKYGDVVHFKAGPPRMRFDLFCVFSPSGVQRVFNDSETFRKDNKIYHELRESLGNGLLTSQDATYLRQRRLLQPLFSNRTVDTYTSLMTEEVSRATHGWETGKTVDVHETATEISLQVMARALYGADMDPVIDVVRRTVPAWNAYTLRRAFEPRSIPRSWSTPANRKAAAAQQEMYAVCDEIIRRRQSRPSDRSTDMLSLLARASDERGRPLGVEEIRDQVLIFLMAGRETTANALGFAMHLLGKHPEIQEKCRAEVMAQIGDRRPLPSDVIRLPYLTRALKEASRLFPSVPQLGRRPTKDTVVDGYRVPAGVDVMIAPWVTHRHPDYWPDPEVFDPDRFLPEREADRPRYAYIPFGGGSRVCIGQYFSMLQSVLALALVLRSYRLDAIDQEVLLDYAITLIPKGPVRCRVTSLHG